MRLLIVEDEPGICTFLKDGLEEEYYAVDIAYDGTEGLEMALSNDYDLLLIDWMLPTMSGVELVQTYRKSNNSTPIIFLTAKDTVHDVVFGLESGANDYIKKPFEFEELLARIRAHLRTANQAPAIMSIEGVELNPSNHQVWFNKKEILLTQKEFALLEFLMRNAGKVCSRTKIIENVWDIHFDTDTSVIDVYVNFIRKKLKGVKAPDIIRTVRGVGYTIRDDQ